MRPALLLLLLAGAFATGACHKDPVNPPNLPSARAQHKPPPCEASPRPMGPWTMDTKVPEPGEIEADGGAK